MKKLLSAVIAMLLLNGVLSQKQIQTLAPTKIAIFKNGTFFVKKEANVPVANKTFYITAPSNVLMGTYWTAVSNEANLQSIIVKQDTFKINHSAATLYEYLQSNIGQQITLQGNAANTELRKLAGKLIDFNPFTRTIKIQMASGNMVISSANDFTWMEMNDKAKNIFSADSITPVAKVNITKDVSNINASTISLQTGIQWVPSYLFTVVNDKEAKLEMKATIVNNDETYRNMPVDIIIGNPEMFFGQTLDPVCMRYMDESLLNYRQDNNIRYSLNNSMLNNGAVQQSSRYNERDEYNGDQNYEQKDGQKMEDLYYYQLGVMDLEKNSRTVVPVMAATVNYSEIYTADLPTNSTNMTGANSIQTYRNYRITNGSNAPFTTGSVFVLNKDQQPIAQSRLTYTPIKGLSEMQLAKAVDVQVKNDEVETRRDKSYLKKNYSEDYVKIQLVGTINITNYKDKKIKIRVTKVVNGNYIKSSNEGKSKKIRNTDEEDETVTEISWEVEVAAGAKMQLQYEYYTLK